MPNAFRVASSEAGLRPDRFLRRRHPALTRSEALGLLKKGHLSTRLGPATLKTVLAADTDLWVADEAGIWGCPIPIVHHAPGWWVVDKPSGMPVHTGTGHTAPESTLLGGTAPFWNRVVAPDLVRERPSAVGRLDRMTSGLMVLARSQRMKKRLSICQNTGQLKKYYLVFVGGHLGGSGSWTSPLRSLKDRHQKSAPRLQETETRWKSLWASAHATLLLAEPITGRKHQIRRHFAQAGHPVVGDARYGARAVAARLLLHAHALRIDDAGFAKKRAFTADLPPRFLDFARGAGLSDSELSARVKGAMDAG
jgi:23S rRNA pseudouridine1911/1915/1917 synthase